MQAARCPGNHYSRFGRTADSTALVSRVGHADDVANCFRDPGVAFHVAATTTLSADSDSDSGTLSVDLPTTYAWKAVASDPGWLTLTSSSGIGPAAITYAAAANPSLTERNATITVAGQDISATQSGRFTQSALAADFTNSIWWSYDIISGSSVAGMNSRGTATFQNASIPRARHCYGRGFRLLSLNIYSAPCTGSV